MLLYIKKKSKPLDINDSAWLKFDQWNSDSDKLSETRVLCQPHWIVRVGWDGLILQAWTIRFSEWETVTIFNTSKYVWNNTMSTVSVHPAGHMACDCVPCRLCNTAASLLTLMWHVIQRPRTTESSVHSSVHTACLAHRTWQLEKKNVSVTLV